jgi:hypothetical protein
MGVVSILVSRLSRDGSQTNNIGELRRLAWSGVPEEVRPIVWQLLLVSRSLGSSHSGLTCRITYPCRFNQD